ncbi:uncharacterized protein [Nicotiana tomentosiformis]|uniref:uncharacterized protein n=1 Tax=Nicotiana tomentosiformis TaxID=4098 RepID=UPI00388CBAF4
MRFLELARHAIWLVPTGKERIRRFVDVLNYGHRFVMTQENTAGARFDVVVDIAQELELVCSQESEEREAKRPRGLCGFKGVSSGGKSYHCRGRPYMLAQMARPVHRSASASHGSYSSCPGQSSLNALPAQSSSCAPSVQGSSMLGPSSSYYVYRGPIQSPPPLGSCFECGEFGHVWRQCPHRFGCPVW